MCVYIYIYIYEYKEIPYDRRQSLNIVRQHQGATTERISLLWKEIPYY